MYQKSTNLSSCEWISLKGLLFVAIILFLSPNAPSQNLFVSVYGSGEVDSFGSSGIPNTVCSGLGPTALAFDNAGNLFVGNSGDGSYGAGTILKITPDGSSQVFATGLWGPFGLAFNSAGDLFADDYNNNIYEYTPQGTRTIFASGLNDPVGMAFDASGNLFVSEWNSGNIDEFTPSGVESTFATGYYRPDGLAFDSAGDLFFVESGNPVFNNSGTVYEITPGGVKTTVVSGMFGPIDLALDNSGNLYVSDTWNNQILEVSPSGAESTFATGLSLPTYLAFQPVPEPSTVNLLFACTFWLFLFRRSASSFERREHDECQSIHRSGSPGN